METQPRDTELVRAARSGDAASLGVLLERHRASMQAVALHLLGYSPEAQDTVQEAMFLAVQRIGDLRDPNAVGPWLRAIVRNACRMHLRARRVAHEEEITIAASSALDLSPDTLLDRHALRDWVWHALESLSEPLQLVVLLRYFSEVSSYHQIAALCGVPIGTVRSRLHQARLKLSAALLAAASSAHDDSMALTERRRREVAELFAAAEGDDFSAALAAVCAKDVVVVGPQGQQGQDAGFVVHAMTSDREAGVRQHPMQVTASHSFTIIEADLVSPPWDPHHCPAGVVWVLAMHDHQVQRIRLFHPHSTAVDV